MPVIRQRATPSFSQAWACSSWTAADLLGRQAEGVAIVEGDSRRGGGRDVRRPARALDRTRGIARRRRRRFVGWTSSLSDLGRAFAAARWPQAAVASKRRNSRALRILVSPLVSRRSASALVTIISSVDKRNSRSHPLESGCYPAAMSDACQRYRPDPEPRRSTRRCPSAISSMPCRRSPPARCPTCATG